MKYTLKLFLIILFTLSLTSCIDYVQSISYKNGKYQMYYKVTFSKMLFAMMDENAEKDFETFNEESLDDFPANTSVSPVNTDLEVGAEFKFSIDPKTTDDTEKSFLPTISGNKCFIPFLLGEKDSVNNSIGTGSKTEGDALADAILSSGKCRILISKAVISSIETAYFVGKGSQNYSIPVFDYGDSHCLEIPLPVLFENGMYRTDRVVVIRK